MESEKRNSIIEEARKDNMTLKRTIVDLECAKAMCKFDPITGWEYFRSDEDRRQYEAFDLASKMLETSSA